MKQNESYFPLMLSKAQASEYLIGYKDIDYINYLLHEEFIGIRILPNKNTSRVIYRRDLDNLIDNLPLRKG